MAISLIPATTWLPMDRKPWVLLLLGPSLRYPPAAGAGDASVAVALVVVVVIVVAAGVAGAFAQILRRESRQVGR